MKKAIICREINGDFTINNELASSYIPKAGDTAVFKVLEIGKHSSIQSVNGNNAYIFPGDFVMMTFGNRYATGQFEGYVPDKVVEHLEILGKGGAVGVLTSMHAKLEHIGPTRVKLEGFVTDSNHQVINTKYLAHAEKKFNPQYNFPKIILSLGASMDSGKTTTAAFVARGLSLMNKRAAYIKLTGTVYTKDRSLVRDSGAVSVCDFSTVGFPSTYMCNEEELLNLYQTLVELSMEHSPEYIIVEIADGLFQRETAMLLNNKQFMQTVYGVIYSSADSLSAAYGAQLIEKMNTKLLFLSGLATASPLLKKEIEEQVSYPVLALADIETPELLMPVLNE